MMNLVSMYAHEQEGRVVALTNGASNLKLNLETCQIGEVAVVHCEGRIVYREEAAALSRTASAVLRDSKSIVLDLGGVERIDSAGLGELVLVRMTAEARGGQVALACPNRRVRELLDLTNLSSVFEIYPTVADALATADRVAHSAWKGSREKQHLSASRGPLAVATESVLRR
jgi:anti-sigma B factor antagonist